MLIYHIDNTKSVGTYSVTEGEHLKKQIKSYQSKGIFLVLTAVLLVVLIFKSGAMDWVKNLSDSKAAVSYENMYSTLENNGFIVTDTIETASKEFTGLSKAISAQKDDVYLSFYIADNISNADKIFFKSEKIIWQQETFPRKGNRQSSNNWTMYSTHKTNDSKHYVVTRVSNTVVYAYSPNEQTTYIYDTLKQIDYPTLEPILPINKYIIKAAAVLMMFISIFITRMSLSWLKELIFEIGKTEKNDTPIMLHKIYKFMQNNSQNKKWKIPFWIYAFCFVPVYLSIVQLILNCFTNVAISNINFTVIAFSIIIFGSIPQIFFNKNKGV